MTARQRCVRFIVDVRDLNCILDEMCNFFRSRKAAHHPLHAAHLYISSCRTGGGLSQEPSDKICGTADASASFQSGNWCILAFLVSRRVKKTMDIDINKTTTTTCSHFQTVTNPHLRLVALDKRKTSIINKLMKLVCALLSNDSMNPP